jgi:hypothetical protein
MVLVSFTTPSKEDRLSTHNDWFVLPDQ